jgi:hypothetical protein
MKQKHMKRDYDKCLKKFLLELGMDEAIILDGLSDAFIGVAEVKGTPVCVYSKEKIVKLLIERGIENPFEAEEYFEFNIRGLHVGDSTPLYVETIKQKEWLPPLQP